MLKIFLNLLVRNFLKDKLLNSLNILGLSLGMVAALLILLYADHEYSYDSFHENSESTYRLEAITNNDASIVTDHIDTITDDGIKLKSGQSLKADIIVKATGIQIVALGQTDFFKDEEAVHFPDLFNYETMMYEGLPNLASIFGYVNASWTLRADLIAEFVLAMKHGLGLNKILGTIHSYPTWAEGNKYAAGEWKRAHAPEKVLNLLEKYHTWRRG